MRPRTRVWIILLALCLIWGTSLVSPASLQQSSLAYNGGFTLPLEPCGAQDIFSEGYLGVGGGGIAYRAAGNGGLGSLLVTTVRGLVGEISIPTPVLNASTSAWNRATTVTSCIDPTEGKATHVFTIPPASIGVCSASSSACLGGMVVIGDELIGTVWIYFDGPSEQRLSHYRRPANLATVGQVTGLYNVGNLGSTTGRVSGYIGRIPTASQALMGGNLFSGGYGISIFTRTSQGPSAFAFPLTGLVGAEGTSIAVTPLSYYTLANPQGSEHQQSLIWNDGAGGGNNGAAFWPTSYTSLAFLHLQPVGPYCYGEGVSWNGSPYVNNSVGTGTNASTNATGTVVSIPNLPASPDPNGAAIWLEGLSLPDIGHSAQWYGLNGELLNRFPGTSFIVGVANLGTSSASVTVNSTFAGNLSGRTWHIGQPNCYDPLSAYKGTHGYPYQARMIVYAESDLLQVAQGTKLPWAIQPTDSWNISEAFLNTPNLVSPGGIAYDPITQRVWVVMRYSEPNGRLAIHQFTIQGLSLSTPANVSITSAVPVVYSFSNPTPTGGTAPYVIVNSPVSGSTFPLGVTTITSTVTDAVLATASSHWTVTVTAPVTPPTPPSAPATPSPVSGTQNINSPVVLSWTASTGVTPMTYNVYFGRSSSPPIAATGLSTPTWTTSKLARRKVYYWQVIARDVTGVTTAGPVWNFKSR